MHSNSKRKKGVIEINIEDDHRGDEQDFKSVSILDVDGEQSILKEGEISQSQSSTYTYDLIDQSVHSSSNSRQQNNLRIQGQSSAKSNKGHKKEEKKSARTLQKTTPISEDEYNDLYEYSDDDEDEEEEDDEIYPFEDSQGTDNQLPIIPSPINIEDSGKSADLSANLNLLMAAGMVL